MTRSQLLSHVCDDPDWATDVIERRGAEVERLTQALREAAARLYRAETHRQMVMFSKPITNDVEDFKTAVIEVQHDIVKVLNAVSVSGRSADRTTSDRSIL